MAKGINMFLFRRVKITYVVETTSTKIIKRLLFKIAIKA